MARSIQDCMALVNPMEWSHYDNTFMILGKSIKNCYTLVGHKLHSLFNLSVGNLILEYLINYGLFLAKTVTLLLAFLFAFSGLLALSQKNRAKEKIKVEKLNKKFLAMRKKLSEAILSAKEFKAFLKLEKKQEKQSTQNRKRIFLLHFNGDFRASQVEALREEVTALLTIATPQDEVVVCLESGGGLVHAYGLAASQLQRIRDQKIPLTIAIDKVAASGGYMMACVGDTLLAAPFAIIGSIGVLAQLPNFNRFLHHHNIDFEQLSAGEYKRTLTLFGENTHKAREKMQEELDQTLVFFKEFIQHNRPKLNVTQVATGEYWLGTRAFELKLVDQLITSDDYLLNASKESDIYKVYFCQKKNFSEKLSSAIQLTAQKVFHLFVQEQNNSSLH